MPGSIAAIEWIEALTRFGTPHNQTADDLHYRAQTGIFRASLMLAVLFFLLAALGVLGLVLL